MTERPLLVRQAVRSDVQALHCLHRKVAVTPWRLETLAQRLNDNPYCLLAYLESAQSCELIGYIIANAVCDEVTLEHIAVTLDYRRQGVAARLLRQLLSVCKQQGQRAVFLEVSERNLTAQALYVALGFSTVGRRENYYQDATGAQAAILMEHWLA